MWLPLLSWKNLWRNRQRTAITMAALFFAVVLSVLTSSLKAGIFDNLVRNLVGYYSGYAQIHKKGYWNERILDNGFIVTDSLKNKLQNTGAVKDFSPRLETFMLASFGDNTKGCMVIGLDASLEKKITNLGSEIRDGKELLPESNDVLLAEGLQHRLGIKTGDTLVLLSQGYHGSIAADKYRVRGTFHSGSPDLNNSLLLMSLPSARQLLGADLMATSLVISLIHPREMNAELKQLQFDLGDQFEVMSWEELMPDIKQHIEADSVNLQVIQGILYLLVAFGIFGTLLMMMQERRYELGMLLAIGMKKYRLMLMLAMESLMTVFSGCVLGMLASWPVVIYLNRNPIRLGGAFARAYERFGFEALFPTSVAAEHFWKQALTVFVIGILLSLYPVYVIWKMEAVKAMRK